MRTPKDLELMISVGDFVLVPTRGEGVAWIVPWDDPYSFDSQFPQTISYMRPELGRVKAVDGEIAVLLVSQKNELYVGNFKQEKCIPVGRNMEEIHKQLHFRDLNELLETAEAAYPILASADLGARY